MLPHDIPKYVGVVTRGIDVRGIPLPAQPTMFITDTFLPLDQKIKNAHYVLPQDERTIPPNAITFYLKPAPGYQ